MNVSERLREIADKLENDANGMTESVGLCCHHWAVRAGRALRSADKLPKDLQALIARIENLESHDDAKSNLVFLQSVQHWMGNRSMAYEDAPVNPSKRSEVVVGKYAENMRQLASAIEPRTGKRVQPDHAITTWVKTHGHKYDNNSAAVREYVGIYGGRFEKLYADLNNDLRKKRPTPRK